MTISGILGLLGGVVGLVGFFIGGGSGIAAMLPRRFGLVGLLLMLGAIPALAIVFLAAALIGLATGWY